MKDGEDPFIAVMNFLEGKDRRAWEFGARLEHFVDSAAANLLAASFLLVCAAILLLFASPFLLMSANPSLRDVGGFMHAASGVMMLCHQLPYRSLIFWGVPMPVCARDVGIYVGGMLGFATLFLKDRPKILSSLRILAVAVVPIALDGITQTVLLMRESNNIIRLITGLAFGFGVMAFIANRLLLPHYPKFREHTIGSRLIIADLAAVIAAVYLVYAGLGQGFEHTYMGGQEALQAALADSSIKGPVATRVFYISSMAPVSLLNDSYYDRHRDLVLDDIKGSPFARERLAILTRQEDPAYPENVSLDEFLDDVADKEHKFGIWAAVILTTEPVQGSAPYIQEGRGEYYYYDALTRKQIMKTTH